MAACADSHIGRVDARLQPYSDGMVVAPKPVGDGFYAVIEKDDGKWSIAHGPLPIVMRRDNPNQEVLFISTSLRSIAPVFEARDMTHEYTICTPYLLDKTRYGYGLCTSELSTVQTSISFARNIFSCLLTFCLASNTTEILDHNKVEIAAIESGFMDWVVNEAWYQRYDMDFVTARDDAAKNAFIEKYRDRDPLGRTKRLGEQLQVEKSGS